MIAVPAAPGGCWDCLEEGTTWAELNRYLVCGRADCCEPSARDHALSRFEQTGHPAAASHSGGERRGLVFRRRHAPHPVNS
jgi:monovalent cation/hydrogen antiporter